MFGDILQHAMKTNDLQFLLHEVKARLQNQIKKAEEIRLLSKRYRSLLLPTNENRSHTHNNTTLVHNTVLNDHTRQI